MTNQGRMNDILAMQMRTVFKAANTTLLLCGHARIQESPLMTQTLPFTSERDYASLMMTQVHRFGIVSLHKNGLLLLLSTMFQDRAQVQGARPPTIVVLGPGTKEIQAHGGENNEFWRAGPKAMSLIEGEDQFQTYQGATIYQGRILDVRNVDGPVADPMTTVATYGLHFTVPARNSEWGCDDRSPKCDYSLVAHDARLDRLETVGFSDLLAANPYYNKDGSLNTTDLRTVLENYNEMERRYHTNVPMFQGNRPLIDPHIATMGDVDPEPYIATMIGESLEYYFSDAKLDRIVRTAMRRVADQVGASTIDSVQWLRERLVNAYNGSAANITANVTAFASFINAGGNKAASVDAGVDIFTRDETDQYGILPGAEVAEPRNAAGDIYDGGDAAAKLVTAMNTLLPVNSVLPDGAATFSWAVLLKDRNDFRANASDADKAKLNEAVTATFTVARELKNIFDLDSEKAKSQGRNPLCTTAALPFVQMPTGNGFRDADKQEMELIALAQNCLFFVGQPVLRNVQPADVGGLAASGPAYALATFPFVLNANAVSNAMFGRAVTINGAAGANNLVSAGANAFADLDNLLARVRQLMATVAQMPEVDSFVKHFFETSSAADVYATLVQPFTQAYENTRAAPDLVAEGETSEMAFPNLLAQYVLAGPAGQTPSRDKALLFGNLVKDLLQKQEPMFSADRLRGIVTQTQREVQTLERAGVPNAAGGRGAAAGGFDLGAIGGQGGAAVYSKLTPFTAHPTKVATGARDGELSLLNPVNHRQRLNDGARMFARGVQRRGVGGALGSETIFDHPHLSSGAMSASSSGAMTHGGAGFTNPVTGRHELSAGGMQQTEAGSTLFSSAVLSTALLNKTFAERVSRASARTNMMTRATELLALCTPFNANVFRQMHNANVEPPITLKVFYPFVRKKTGCAYVGCDGVGKSRIEFPNSLATTGETGAMVWRFDMHYGVGVTRPRDLTVAHNTIFREYLGGMSVQSLTQHSHDRQYASLYDMDESASGTSVGDGFVTSVGVSYKETSPVLDITGMFMPQSYRDMPPAARNASKFFENPQYPGALFHSIFLRTVLPMGEDYSLDDHKLNFHEYRHWAQNSINTICHRGRQWRYDESGNEVEANPGWGLGKNIVPGRMALVYAGKTMLNTEATVRQIAY
jgi:hypothetical protein